MLNGTGFTVHATSVNAVSGVCANAPERSGTAFVVPKVIDGEEAG